MSWFMTKGILPLILPVSFGFSVYLYLQDKSNLNLAIVATFFAILLSEIRFAILDLCDKLDER